MEKKITVTEFAGTWRLLLKLPPVEKDGVKIERGYSNLPSVYQKIDTANIAAGTYLLVVTSLDGESHIQGEFTKITFNKQTLEHLVLGYFDGKITISDSQEPIMWGLDEHISTTGLRGWIGAVTFTGLSNEMLLSPGKWRVVLISADGKKHIQKEFTTYEYKTLSYEQYVETYCKDGVNLI